MPSAIAHLKEWREPFRIRVAIKKQNDYSKLNSFRLPEKNTLSFVLFARLAMTIRGYLKMLIHKIPPQRLHASNSGKAGGFRA
ncbi:MAG: hypothetical protein IKI11_04320 [Neisseriaceae bacterium]|nr:hypothetical protein [Neisseriaceae bacterium]